MLESFYEQEQSDLSFIDHYWHMTENHDGHYPLYATVKWGFVFSDLSGSYKAKIIGPRTTPTKAPFRKKEYFWGVVVNAEVNLMGYSKKDLLNNIIDIPLSKTGSFVLAGATIQLPRFSELDSFVGSLIQRQILHAAPIAAVSLRDKQRKLKQHTGLTPKQIQQANRVEQAIAMINKPLNLPEVAAEAGFSDQAHMTRDFKRLVGYSPADIRALFRDDEI